MPYIKVIHPDKATGRLAEIYQRVTGPNGQVDNVLQIHSLRPHTLQGHMALYKAVLHHPRNKLPTWFLECIGVRVSLLNDCAYCARHHSTGMLRQLKGDEERFEAYRKQLEQDQPGAPFTAAEQAALVYADKLTREPGAIGPDDIRALRNAGLKGGHILEVNQVAAYFAYANRTVTGLGVDTEGEVLGLHPDDSEEGWHHE
ncbi:MAG: peroxidase-related enzyme [Xanthomonadales bacterium]|nr:peroxidase-related enzyme [Gammaproteobacteria bacterium]MBT8054412.1 peroxidase-related enzyme [Gammaproteobacteria bacterium]NND56776.1 peroxidase-related enzyme [Xanthomonadales bacterium]